MEEVYWYLITERKNFTLMTNPFDRIVDINYDHSRIYFTIFDNESTLNFEYMDKILELIKSLGCIKKTGDIMEKYALILKKELNIEEREEFNILFLNYLKELGLNLKEWK